MSTINLLNQLQCYTTGHNTGRPACDKEPGIPAGGFLIPKGYKFPRSATATAAAFRAALLALSIVDSVSGRLLPISGIEEAENTGEARAVQTSKSGNKRTVRGARIGWGFTIWAGKVYHSVLSKLNGTHAQYDFLMVDENDVVWGTTKRDAAGLSVLGGYALNDIFTDTYQGNDGSNGGQFKFNVELQDADEFDKYFAFFQCDTAILTEVVGVQDVKIQATAGATATKVKVYASANGVDLKDSLDDELAVVGGYKVTNAEVLDSHYGNTITVTGVAKIAGGWELTLDSTDVDNPGTGKKVAVSFPALSVLAALTLPITGLESDIFIVTLA